MLPSVVVLLFELLALWLVVLLLLLLLLMCEGGLACIDPALVSVEMYCFLSMEVNEA